MIWLVNNIKKGEHLDKAVRLMKDNFADYSNLQALLPEFDFAESKEINPFLESLVERRSDLLTRGAACYTLALRLKQQAERRADKRLASESVRQFERVLHEFADVNDRRPEVLGEGAKRELENLRGPLGIGRFAPEIDGKDVDGRKFRLTAYRGKVVILGFSGRWCGALSGAVSP
jgi:hypothetical protein